MFRFKSKSNDKIKINDLNIEVSNKWIYLSDKQFLTSKNIKKYIDQLIVETDNDQYKIKKDDKLKIEFANNEEALNRIKNVLSAETVLALKKGKQGRKRILKETDIKPYIDKYSLSIREGAVVLNVRLAAGQVKNLNPSLFFDTIIRLIDMDFEWKSISRIALLDKNYKEFR